MIEHVRTFHKRTLDHVVVFYPCKICGSTFRSLEQYNIHKKATHDHYNKNAVVTQTNSPVNKSGLISTPVGTNNTL